MTKPTFKSFLLYNIFTIIIPVLSLTMIYYVFHITIKINNDLLIINMIISFLISLIVIILLLHYYYKRTSNLVLDISDNVNIFRTPFHKNYYKNTLSIFNNIIVISRLSILIALILVSKKITIPTGFGILGSNISYIFIAITSAIFGPFASLVVGASTDVLGYYIVDTPVYPFNPLYTISAMLAAYVYSVFFYKSKITFVKCFYARFIVNILINAMFGSILYALSVSFTKQQTITYFLTKALPKNVIYLIPETILLYLSFKMLRGFLKTSNLLNEKVCDNITLF